MVVVESGLSFPAGLRVLVVDDDPTWLKILEKMLKKCSYEVTTCGLARKALRLLRERRDGFDIVISDVNMPDMDGFKLLEHVGLGMDLPVIMMSVDGETSRVMKGVQHGACDYLLKPIRMKELKNIWQHVLRKRMHEIRDKENHDNLDDGDDDDGVDFQLFSYAADVSDGGRLLGCADRTFLKKRKDLDRKNGDRDLTDFSAKRPRVVWSIDLHQKFVKAVSQIGFDKLEPKKVLDMMNVPWLTRENVASHLQKYRLYLSRLGIEDEMKNSCGGGFKYSHQSPKDYGGGSGIQNPTAPQRSEAGVVNFSSPGHKTPEVQSVDTKPYEIGPDGITTWPVPEPRDPFTSDISDVHITTCGPKMGLDNSVGSQKSKISYPEVDYIRASELTWSRQLQHSPSEFVYKPHQQVLEIPFANESKVFSWLEDCFCHGRTVHVPQQPDTCLCQRRSVLKRDNLGIIDAKLMCPDISNNRTKQPLDIFGLTANCSVGISQTTAQNGPSSFEFEQRNHISGSESSTMGLDDTGCSEYNFPDFSNEGSPNLHVWETKIQLGVFW